MDFDSRFDCCKACNSISFQCQNNRTPRQIQGQGDCKCNTEGSKNVWMSLDKGKKLRNKCGRDRNQSDTSPERQQNFPDGHCYCFAKEDFPDKLKRELKPKTKKDFGNYEACKYFWDSPSSNWTSKSETYFTPEQQQQLKRNDYANPDKVLAENILEFEEKVDFLFRIFKDYGQKFPPEGYLEQAKAKPGEGMLKDFAHLFDFNKRLCAAEEGIENLALILEDLVKESGRKTEETYNDPVDFDEMSVSQRINYLKSRNDLMLSFMKAFFKSGFAEEYYNKLALLPSDLKPVNTKADYGEKHQSADLNRVKIMEALQKLRMRMTELRQKKSQLYGEQQKTRNEKKGETAVKFARNKLEVISEQAELALSDESENAADDFGEKTAVRILNEKLSEVTEESDESDFGVQDVTFRILAQETEFLKPPLDKLFSKLDPPEKKFLNGSNIQITLKEENEKGDVAINYDSTSDLSCFFCDGEKSEKTRDRNKVAIYTKQKDFKEPPKREKNSPDRLLKDSCKQGGGKKGEDYLEGGTQSGRKILEDENYRVVFPGKGNRSGCSVPELCSPSREERKREVRRKEQRQRPMTDPSSHRKTLPASKPPLPEKYATRNSGTNNVKSKNKILLSKKSCVQTS